MTNITFQNYEVEKILPNDYNPNIMVDSKFNHLKEEIQRIGFLDPVLINKEGIIIDGEHRWKAAKEIGLTHIPVIITDITNEEAKLQTINLNEIKGEIEPHKMAELLESLKTNYDTEQLKQYLNLTENDLTSYNLLHELPELIETSTPQGNEPTTEGNITCPLCGEKFNL